MLFTNILISGMQVSRGVVVSKLQINEWLCVLVIHFKSIRINVKLIGPYPDAFTLVSLLASCLHQNVRTKIGVITLRVDLLGVFFFGYNIFQHHCCHLISKYSEEQLDSNSFKELISLIPTIKLKELNSQSC